MLAEKVQSMKYYFKLGNLNNFTSQRTILSTRPKWTTKITKKAYKNDILMSVRAPVGPVNFATQEICIGRGLASIKSDESILNQKYLFYFLKSIELEIQGNKGAIFNSINKEQIESIKTPLPPLKIQQEIVAECEEVDKEVEEANNLIRVANEQIKSKLIYKVIGSQELTLNEICSLKAGKFVKADDIYNKAKDGLYNCFGGNGLRGYTSTFTHDGNYSLIGRQGALCGNVKWVSGKFHATEHALVVTPKDNTFPKWLFYNLEQMNLNQYAKGVAQPGISVSNIKNIKTILPPFDKQKEIVAFCEQQEGKIKQAQSIIDNAQERKNAILKKYL